VVGLMIDRMHAVIQKGGATVFLVFLVFALRFWSVMYIAIALFTALFVSFCGWRMGFFRLALRLSALLLAYAFTWQVAPQFAHYLSDKGWLSGLLVWPVAGLLLFVGSSAVLSAFARLLGKLAPEEWQEGGKLTGAISGALLGAALGLLVVWTVGVLRDSWILHEARESGADKIGASVLTPEVGEAGAVVRADHLIRDLSADTMAALVRGALGNGPAATVATQWVRQPLSMSAGLEHLAGKPELRMLFQDPNSYAVLVRGSTGDIIRLPQFQALTSDPQVMQFLSVAGLPGEALAQQSQALAEILSRYARNFEKLRTTPEFQALAQDAELRQKLQQGNLLVLLTNDKMRRLAAMLEQGVPSVQLPAATSLQQHTRITGGAGKYDQLPEVSAGAKQEGPSKPLYRWQDAKGHVHITEEKPPEGVKADVIQY
jgi:hypothetical protein